MTSWRTDCEYAASRCFSSVLRRAFSALHSIRKSHDQLYSLGSAENLKRRAWSRSTSDLSRIIGAFGDDQTKECPGATIPALPQLVSDATMGCLSMTVTSCPSLC